MDPLNNITGHQRRLVKSNKHSTDWVYLRNHETTCIMYVISQIWDVTRFWYPSPWKPTISVSCIDSSMGPYVHATQVAKSLTQWGRDKMATSSQTTFPSAFSWKKVWISIKISLKFGLSDQINNIPVLAQIMACRRPGDEPLSEPMIVS